MNLTCVHVSVKPDRIEEFIEATKKNHEGTRKEPGNLRFDVIQLREDPSQFILYEAFVSDEAVEHHRTTAHYLAWREAVADWMAQPRQGVRYNVIAPLDTDQW